MYMCMYTYMYMLVHVPDVQVQVSIHGTCNVRNVKIILLTFKPSFFKLKLFLVKKKYFQRETFLFLSFLLILKCHLKTLNKLTIQRILTEKIIIFTNRLFPVFYISGKLTEAKYVNSMHNLNNIKFTVTYSIDKPSFSKFRSFWNIFLNRLMSYRPNLTNKIIISSIGLFSILWYFLYFWKTDNIQGIDLYAALNSEEEMRVTELTIQGRVDQCLSTQLVLDIEQNIGSNLISQSGIQSQ